MTLYRASKEYKIPWSTLKENLERVKEKSGSSNSNTQVTVTKMGRPYALSVDVEHQLVSYIIKMQELGFGLTVNKIRQLAYTLAEAVGKKHRFNSEKKCAGWSWWVNFKERFGLSLRAPENLSVGPNPAILEDFYDKLETSLVQHGLMDCPERIWNCDETGLTFVNKPNKVVTKIGKKYIYNRTYAEKGTTTTVLACINAAGCFIPPMVIFKGVRNIPELSNGSLPNSLTRLSPKGWINASLFLEWLKFFAASIPPARPVMLIMDSHASHINPSVLEYARYEHIVLFTMPAHTSHLLQPLDVGVFRPLKVAWREELQNYKYSNPTSTPTRFDFHNFFTPAFDKSFTASNVRAGFRRAGIYPLNKNAICPEVTAPSEVTDKPLPSEETTLQEVFVQPDFDEVIPQSEISKQNGDPLHDAAAAGSEALKDPNRTFEVTSYNAQVCNKFVMECDAHQVAASSTTSPVQHELECLTGSNGQIRTDDCEAPSTSSSVHSSQMEASISMSRSQIAGIKILEILELPKWTPKAKKNPRSVPKAVCLTAVEQHEPVSNASSASTEKTHTKNLDAADCSTSMPSTSSSHRSSNDKGSDISVPKIHKKDNIKTRAILSPKRKKITKSAVKQKVVSNTKRTTRKLQQEEQKTADDWICNSCRGMYSEDISLKNGADWITCSFCFKPYHLHCQGQDVDKNQAVFMCDLCSVDPDDSDSDF
ncbi:uncharacterized protein [Choristoneura fumiferana]|uniref:uncharacterized protein n=1 Tax=Choristoneura fumiferana TaxID=7141 RepID=UPI003D154214